MRHEKETLEESRAWAAGLCTQLQECAEEWQYWCNRVEDEKESSRLRLLVFYKTNYEGLLQRKLYAWMKFMDQPVGR